MNISRYTQPLQLALRGAVAAALAVAILQQLNLAYPAVGLIGSVIVTDLDPARTRQLALRRLTGTLLAAAIGIVTGWLLPSGPLSIGVAVMAAIFAAHLVGLDQAARVAGYVAGLVVLAPGGASSSGYALQRVIETGIGIGTAVLVSFVPKLLRLETPAASETDRHRFDSANRPDRSPSSSPPHTADPLD